MTQQLIDLATEYRAPVEVVDKLRELAGLSLLLAGPPFVTQRLPEGAPALPPREGETPPPSAEAYFVAFAPAEIESGVSFELSIRAFVSALKQTVVEEERAGGSESLVGEAPVSLRLKVDAEVRVTLQMPGCFTVGEGDQGLGVDPPSRVFRWSGSKDGVSAAHLQSSPHHSLIKKGC